MMPAGQGPDPHSKEQQIPGTEQPMKQTFSARSTVQGHPGTCATSAWL